MEILDLHKNLVEIKSDENVSEVRDYIIGYLEDNNETSKIDEAGNIISSKGTGEPHIVFNSHMDTVSPHIEYNKEGDTVKGRGASDAKGPLSVLLDVFTRVEPEGKITLAITPDEETETKGSQYLSETGFSNSPDLVIVGEPTNLQVCKSAMGYYPGRIDVIGEAGHSSSEDSDNPIKSIPDVLSYLENMEEESDTHQEFGQCVVEPTIIKGGDVINQTPEKVTVKFTFREVPMEEKSVEELLQGLNTNLEENVSDYSMGVVESEPRLKAFELGYTNKLTSDMIKNPKSEGFGYFEAATEASHFVDIGWNVCIFGPGKIEDEEGPIAHSEREYINTDEIMKARDILLSAVES